MKAQVYVTLKKGVLDPQGDAVKKALETLGYKGQIEGIRQGKFFEVNLADMPEDKAKKILAEISDKLLANTVIEDFRFEVNSK